MDENQLAVIEKTLSDLLGKSLGQVETSVEGKLNEVLEAKFNEFVETHSKSLAAKNTLPVNPESARMEKYKSINSFIKNVLDGNVEAIQKGMTEKIDSDGGFLVPEEFHTEVMRIAEDYGLVARFAQIFPMGSDTLNIPTEASSVTVYWNDEAEETTDTKPTINNAQLNAKNVTGITVTSNQLLADSKTNVTEYLMNLFAEAIAGAIDYQAFRGTGSPFTGILNVTEVDAVTMGSGQTAFTSVTLKNLRDMIARIKVSCLPTSAFFMHRTVWAAVQEIQENSQTVAAFQNQLINAGVAGADMMSGRPAGYLWGYPVYLSDVLPAISDSAVSTDFIIFGSMKKGLFFGDREQTSMAISQHATIGGKNLFASNQSAVRVTQRVAVKVGLAAAFTKLKTAAS